MAGMIRIQREIVRFILDRRLAPGEPLPTETDLVESLGVSRNSVREALKALQALDIVEVRHGYGTYVGHASLGPLADGLTFRTLAGHGDDLHTLAEILEVREVLEAGLIRRVAESVSEDELSRLDALVDRMEAGVSPAEDDRAFHELLYRPLGNEFAPQLLWVFWSVLHRVARTRGWTAPPPAANVGRHRAIATALRRRDPDAAQAAMEKHFRGMDTRIKHR